MTLPAGYKAGEMLWPAPARHVSNGGLLDHVYEGRAMILLPVEVPADAKPRVKKEAARKAIGAFAGRAFRRSVMQEEIDRFANFIELAEKNGDG